MSDTMINTSKKRSYQVPYEVLEKGLNPFLLNFFQMFLIFLIYWIIK